MRYWPPQDRTARRLRLEDHITELESDLSEALSILGEALGELEATWAEEGHAQGWPFRAASLLAK